MTYEQRFNLMCIFTDRIDMQLGAFARRLGVRRKRCLYWSGSPRWAINHPLAMAMAAMSERIAKDIDRRIITRET